MTPVTPVTPVTMVRKKRPLRLPAPWVRLFETADGVALRLTRYQGGGKGPVMLAHGLGVSGRIFTLDTVETNLVELLCAAGFDVWNLESRASIDLPTSQSLFTLDQVAQYDYPAALAQILEVTKAAAVQVVAHCFGASTFTMSMLGGYAGNVRSVVFSQISAHADVPFLTELKGGLHVPDLLERLGVTSLTAYAGEQTGWADRPEAEPR